MAKKTNEPKQPLYILISESREYGSLRVNGRVVSQRLEGGALIPYGPDDDYSDGTLYSDLRLTCLGDDYSRQRALTGDSGAVYGFDVEYRDVFGAGLRRAVRMAKTLTMIDVKLSKLQEQRGYVRTYGEYVGRVAEALGCVGIGFERTGTSRQMTGERWAWDSIGYGIDKVNRLIAAWVEEGKPQAVAS